MILYTEAQIQDRLKYLAYEIGKQYDEVTLLITLTGGIYTGIDLSKYLTIPCKLEFAKVSSYGNDEESSIVELKWISVDKGSNLGNIIIVDDICDTGKTLDYLIKYLKNNYTYNTIKTLALLDKRARREIMIEPDYKGFNIHNYFVYGYGMDNKGYDRNITNIKTDEVTEEK